jgi:hypothetical protein
MTLVTILSFGKIFTLERSDFKELESFYKKANLPFINYLFSSSCYKLEHDRELKWQYGLNSLYTAVNNGRVEEARLVFEDMLVEYPEQKQTLNLEFAKNLMLNDKLLYARSIIKEIEDNSDEKSFLNAYYQFRNQIDFHRSNSFLKEINTNKDLIIAADSLFIMARDFDNLPKKSRTLAISLSAIVPGSGQLYAGFMFEGFTSFLYCASTGLATTSSFLYENSLDSDKRSYILPALSTSLFLVAYVSNIYNAANLTKRRRVVEQHMHRKRMDITYKRYINKINPLNY